METRYNRRLKWGQRWDRFLIGLSTIIIVIVLLTK